MLPFLGENYVFRIGMIKINLDIANLLLSLSIKKVFGGMVVSMFFVKILLLGSRQLGLPKVDMYIILKKSK